MIHTFGRSLYILLFALLTLLPACTNAAILSEEFTQANTDRWKLEEDGFGRSTITNGRLILQIGQPNTMQFATLRTPLLNDFVLQVDGVLVAGNPHSSYGVLFRQQENGMFYRFEISGNGLFVIEKRHSDGSWEKLTPTKRWERTSAINVGLNQLNQLKIAAQGQTIVFSVNNNVILRLDNFDNSLGAGTIALSAGTLTQDAQVAFDNLFITRP